MPYVGQPVGVSVGAVVFTVTFTRETFEVPELFEQEMEYWVFAVGDTICELLALTVAIL